MLLENVNNQKKKREKLKGSYSLVLLVLLFIGMSVYGTYAYFTDNAKIDGEIELHSGTVQLAEAESAGWIKEGDNPGPAATGQKIFEEIQPGDYYTKTFKVKYTGTLDADVKLILNKDEIEEQTKNGYFSYKVVLEKDGVPVAEDDTITVKKNEEMTVVARAGMTTREHEEIYRAEGETNSDDSRNRSGGVALKFIEIENLISLKATQKMTAEK